MRTALSIAAAVGRIPDAIRRRMQPELEQNVIGFERGVGGESRTSSRPACCSESR